MKITFFGTTTLLFDDGTTQVLFDAHITRPPVYKMFFGKIQTNASAVDKIIAAHKIDRLRAIFISHSHHDHALDAPYIAQKCGAVIYGSASALNIARGGGVAEARLHLYGAGGSAAVYEAQIGDFKITVLKSVHSKPNIFNNNIGQSIDSPLAQPAPFRAFKEGGSFDFLVENGGKRYLIRPSFNYLRGELDGIKADVLFLGTAGLSRAKSEEQSAFFRETADKVQPALIIPIHWDFFFGGLDKYIRPMPPFIENTWKSFYVLSRYCEKSGVSCFIQPPLSSIIL